MQKQLMQLSEFADGTIYKEIEKINKHISDKLLLAVDLQSKVVVVSEEGAKMDEDQRMKEIQKQLDGYIFEFIQLNSRNQSTLDEHQAKADKELESREKTFVSRLAYNLEEMKALAIREDQRQSFQHHEV